jgi:hypothetical protein
MGQHIANAKQKPQTAQESLQLQKDVEDHIIDRDLPILSSEKELKKGCSSFWRLYEWVNLLLILNFNTK